MILKINWRYHDQAYGCVLFSDDVSIAEELSKRVRVLCWVMTQEKNHKSKAQHVKATWGKRCNKLLFISDTENTELPTIKLNVSKGRDHLTAKTMQAFDIVYQKYINDYDWFMKADDDTYVIVENLRYMLSTHSPTDPVYFGHHFKVIVKQGYFSGGGGYVLSREALTRYGKRSQNLCSKDQGAEDVEMGRCMEKLKVKTGDSRDALGRTRFHCFNVETHLQGGYPDWYIQYDKYGATHVSMQESCRLNSLRPRDACMRPWPNHHCFRQWLVAWPAPRHYRDQYWNIVNWTLRNKLQWNYTRNSDIFIQEKAFESVVCEMTAICLRLNVSTYFKIICPILNPWFAAYSSENIKIYPYLKKKNQGAVSI